MQWYPYGCLLFSFQMNMLMKLQEAANYSGTQGCDADGPQPHEDTVDAALESTL